MVITLSIGCQTSGTRSHSASSQATAKPTSVHPTTAPTLLSLIARTDNRSDQYWENAINRAEHPGLAVFNLAARDAFFRDLVQQTGQFSAQKEVLIIELFSRSSGNAGVYERAGVSCSLTAPDPGHHYPSELREIGPEQFRPIRQCVELLLKSKRLSDKPMHDLDEWFFVSYFDGNVWHFTAGHDISSEFNFLDPQPKSAQELPAGLRAIFNLIQLLNWNLSKDDLLFGSEYFEAVRQYGEFPVNGNALPAKDR